MNGSVEVLEKMKKVRQFMHFHQYDVLRLQTPNLFAWVTGGGRNYVDFSSNWTGAVLYITPDRVVAVFADNERERILQEELLGKLNCEVRTYPWWGWADDTVSDLLQDRRIASDIGFSGMNDVGEALRTLFYPLLPIERDRYSQLANETTQAFIDLVPHLHPGLTEQQISGMLAGILMEKGMIPVVLMVAADERASKFNHPLPTDHIFQKYLVVSVCVSRGGLVISQTRSIHVGSAQQEMKESHYAACFIASTLMAHSIEGETYEHLFEMAQDAYRQMGGRDEWRKHHFGGPTGYRTREFTVGPNSKGSLQSGVPIAWNPTIKGAKSEDSLLVGKKKPILLGEHSHWPMLPFEIKGTVWYRPDILTI